jgi:hypothetical protein
MPPPACADIGARSISVEGYARKDDVVNLSRKGCEGLWRWLRKIEKPKSAAVPTVV